MEPSRLSISRNVDSLGKKLRKTNVSKFNRENESILHPDSIQLSTDSEKDKPKDNLENESDFEVIVDFENPELNQAIENHENQEIENQEIENQEKKKKKKKTTDFSQQPILLRKIIEQRLQQKAQEPLKEKPIQHEEKESNVSCFYKYKKFLIFLIPFSVFGFIALIFYLFDSSAKIWEVKVHMWGFTIIFLYGTYWGFYFIFSRIYWALGFCLKPSKLYRIKPLRLPAGLAFASLTAYIVWDTILAASLRTTFINQLLLFILFQNLMFFTNFFNMLIPKILINFWIKMLNESTPLQDKNIINMSQKKPRLMSKKQKKLMNFGISKARKLFLQQNDILYVKKNEALNNKVDIFVEEIMSNADIQEKGYLTYLDFELFFHPHKAKKAFLFFLSSPILEDSELKQQKITQEILKPKITDFFIERGHLKKTIQQHQSLSEIVKKLLKFVYWVIMIIVFLIIIKVDLGSLFLALVTLLVSLSFAFSGIIKNFVDSLTLIFGVKPYDTGDIISINDTRYTIKGIDLYKTTLEDFSGKLTTITNWSMLSKDITNYKRSSRVSIYTIIGISSKTSTKKIIQFGEKLDSFIKSNPESFEPKFSFKIDGLDKSTEKLNLRFNVTIKCNSWQEFPIWTDLKNDFYLFCNNTFNELGIAYEYPSMDLDIIMKNSNSNFKLKQKQKEKQKQKQKSINKKEIKNEIDEKKEK
ncbi:mechanosensitive ion channel protein [Anaeramoeba ignava]|uniref:Mechanosensitive ion channel protein n=1 Tax=Anaeramoeba ignava TaxID=1746090 RepID=A0A9Q0L5R7_ANAIG|nr:mechanosensitive ion channel protein [Anaeramoeba ignava]